jgi:hypothetical protein
VEQQHLGQIQYLVRLPLLAVEEALVSLQMRQRQVVRVVAEMMLLVAVPVLLETLHLFRHLKEILAGMLELLDVEVVEVLLLLERMG